ncbi:hypothetical protein TSUD_274690 [Trifolium subterraneum]|uniref:Uncharacterized protein n=1 Tax=Trifolium subterraneum TaxID=3900 RepID=A0A2Z6MXN9_TRISU|nr:hypothetical protein TSUD_274690 [Trifolium subterraneum]
MNPQPKYTVPWTLVPFHDLAHGKPGQTGDGSCGHLQPQVSCPSFPEQVYEHGDGSLRYGGMVLSGLFELGQ